MLKIIRLAIVLLFAFVLLLAQPAFAKSSDRSSSGRYNSSASSHRSSSSHPGSKTTSHSASHKEGNCDYPWQTDSAGRSCGNRSASVRIGGRLGGYL
jgi:ABC-type dipeptide/oligopeptide/nickel transport system permease subunit